MEPEMRVKFALAVAGKRLESKEYEDAEKICDRAIKLYGDSKEVGKNARGLLFATRGSAYFAYRACKTCADLERQNAPQARL